MKGLESSVVRFWWEGEEASVRKNDERMKQRNTDVSGIEKLRCCFFFTV